MNDFLSLRLILDSLNIIYEILFSFLKILAVLLIFFFCFMLVWKISKEEGMIIMPFETPTGEAAGTFNGKAISDLVKSELQRIRRIHDLKFEEISNESEKRSIPTEPLESGWTDKVLPTSITSGKLSIPNVISQWNTLEYGISSINTVGIGSASLSLEVLIAAFKRLCPGCNPLPILKGSLQIYGNIIIITACLEENDICTWEVRRSVGNVKVSPEQFIPSAP